MSRQALYSHNLACFTILYICDTLACIRATWLNFVLAHTFNGLIISHFSSLVSFVRRSFVSVKKSKIGGALSHSQAQTYCILNRSKVVVRSMELNHVYRMIGFYFLFDFMCANNRLNMLNYTENFIFSGKWFAQCANTFSHAVKFKDTVYGRPYGRVRLHTLYQILTLFTGTVDSITAKVGWVLKTFSLKCSHRIIWAK